MPSKSTAKEVDWIRAKLIKAEENLDSKVYVNKSPDEILASFKDKAKLNSGL